MNKHYSIREAAERTGVTAHTLRYYEQIGLLKPIQRTSSGYRCYTDDDLGWVDFLTCLRATGMSIQGMLQFVRLAHTGEHTVPTRCDLLEEHRDALHQRIRELQEYLSVIDAKITTYRTLTQQRLD